MSKREAKRSLIPLIFLLTFSGVAVSSAFAASSGMGTVWVTKPDGSLQCDDPKSRPKGDVLASAKSTLERAGVKVLDSKKRNDGAMRAQMCGIPTGNETSLLISKKDLAKVKALGFEAIP